MQGVSFSHPEKEIRDRAIDIFTGIMDVGSEFGSDINISRIRGAIPEGDSLEVGLSRLSSCLEPLCRRADALGINLVLEQMNRYETNYLMSVQEIGDYIRHSGFPALKIHADTFHMNIEDMDMLLVLEKNKDLLGYIHFADSNRLAPGWGHIDFDPLLTCLKNINYEKYIGIEVLREPDSVQAAKQAISFLKNREKIINKGISTHN
jgi:sugar phosphate isomerase/epimerase